MKRIMWILALVLAAGALAAAGCGDDDDDGGNTTESTPAATEEATVEPETAGGGGEGLTLTADPGGSISWEPAELTASAGEVTIELVNESMTPHAVEVEGNGVEEESETVTAGNATLAVDLEPGEYVYYCPVGNHRQGGMEGTLTVE